MQSKLIRLRVADDEKLLFTNAAHGAGLSVSEMLRRAGRAAAAGRIASRSVLIDLASIRCAANRLAALVDNPDTDPAAIAEAVKVAADDLRAIAARHLGHVK